MSTLSDQVQASDTQDSLPIQPGRFERARSSREVQGVGLGGVLLTAVTASLLTRMYLRRRARARLRRLATVMFTVAAARRSMPSAARGAAPFGGMGIAMLLGALLHARLQEAQQPRRNGDEASDRLALLRAYADAHPVVSERPHPRDLVLGAAIGLGLAGLLARGAASSRTSD